jgi:hypothetical protein
MAVFSRSEISSHVLIDEYRAVTLDQLHNFPFRTRMPFEFVDQDSFVECKLAALRVKVERTALISVVWTDIEFKSRTWYIVGLDEARQRRPAGPVPMMATKIEHYFNPNCMMCGSAVL